MLFCEQERYMGTVSVDLDKICQNYRVKTPRKDPKCCYAANILSEKYNSSHKISWSVYPNYRIYGYPYHQFAKSQNLTSITFILLEVFSWIFHQILLSIRSADGPSLVDLAQWWCSLSLKDPPTKEVSRAWDQAKIQNFSFLSIIMLCIPEWIIVQFFIKIYIPTYYLQKSIITWTHFTCLNQHSLKLHQDDHIKLI